MIKPIHPLSQAKKNPHNIEPIAANVIAMIVCFGHFFKGNNINGDNKYKCISIAMYHEGGIH